MEPLRTQGLDHVAITVEDLSRSRRFYTEVLGLEPKFDDRAREERPSLGIDPHYEDHGSVHSIYFGDHDGHQIELTTDAV